jgi:hypothetical protein
MCFIYNRLIVWEQETAPVANNIHLLLNHARGWRRYIRSLHLQCDIFMMGSCLVCMDFLYTRQYRAIIFFDCAFFWIGSFAANTQFYVNKTFMIEKNERNEKITEKKKKFDFSLQHFLLDIINYVKCGYTASSRYGTLMSLWNTERKNCRG